jgi:5,10-methylenetetrahydromethanopterin reductase
VSEVLHHSQPLGLATGVVARVRSIAEVQEVARAAEESGFDLLGIADSQSLVGDVSVCLAAAAMVTKRMRLATCVTKVATRHLRVTAAAIRTVDDIARDRVVLGLRRGDSSVINLGLAPTGLAKLCEAADRLRELFAGHPVVVGTGVAHSRSGAHPGCSGGAAGTAPRPRAD